MGFYCKKCGQEYSSLSSLTSAWCSRGSNEHCVPYEGHEHGSYHCKKCGQEYSSLRSLTNAWCSRCSNEHCKPFNG